jgi:dolichol-phosphate mannosyltransferase
MRGPAWIVLPTYCEAENLEPMARALRAVLPGDARILVVDDASPDGTGAVADRLAAQDPRLAVLHRPGKAGLGPAYLAGFAHALAHGAGAVVEMDCDFSHDPETVPALLGALADGADLALGSRYVPGGRVENWSAWRRAVSRGGCVYAQLVLRAPVRDLTGGFKAFRAEALHAIDYGSARARGYAFQVELTYRALRAGLRVTELPIVFHERREGDSKMSGAIALEAAWRVPALRLQFRARDADLTGR